MLGKRSNFLRKKQLSDKRYRKSWKRLTAVLSVFVILGTLSSLMLPAITMNKDQCVLTEHSHGPECYSGDGLPHLTCDGESLGIHVHSEACYAGEALVCGEADFVLHSHDALCLDGDGVLVCTLPELAEHRHEDGCWTVIPGHTHEAGCYAWTCTENLTCTLAEGEGHAHGETCFDAEGTLTCTQTEAQPHTHGESCYEAIQGERICTLEETQEQKTLTCTKPELTAHVHNDDCYQVPEIPMEAMALSLEMSLDVPLLGEAPETETAETQPDPTETQPEPQVPQEAEPRILICGQTQLLSHQHTESCVTRQERQLICTIPEHTHLAECFPEETQNRETAGEWEADLPELSGDWAKDLVRVAQSQLGYTESVENLSMDADGQLRGYTRYGQWSGQPYADWRVPFLGFCLRYSDIPQEAIPGGADLSQWRTALTEAGLLQTVNAQYPRLGDLVFLDRDGDGAADAAGILAEALEGQPIAEGAASMPTSFPAPVEETTEATQETQEPAAETFSLFQSLDMDLLGQSAQTETTAAPTETTGAPTEPSLPSEEPTQPTGQTLVTLEGGCYGAVAQVRYVVDHLLDYVSLSDAENRYAQRLAETTGKKPYSLTHRGEDYTLTVSYGPEAQLPKDVTLSVRELLPGEEEYETYMAQLTQSISTEELVEARFFDVTFYNALGEKLQPAEAVDMEILYDEVMQMGPSDLLQVIHFDEEEGMEFLPATPVTPAAPEVPAAIAGEGEEPETENPDILGVQYSQDSFSVSAVVTRKNPASLESTTVNMPLLNAEGDVVTWVDAVNGTNTATMVEDTETVDSWKERYDTANVSTEYAGGVYVDKSVFSSGVSYNNGSTGGTVTRDSQDNFLVGLSTMASTMSVYGQESAPTDVMFILDLSSSMYPGLDPETVQLMVEALNKSMDNLLNNLNPNNRVGVTIYFGGGDVMTQSDKSHGKVLLPLGRYTKGNNGTYISVNVSNGDLTGVRVSAGVKNEAGTTMTANTHSVASVAGTYAQVGILHAMDEFLDATTTVTVNGKVVPRRPVFVFMSDGEPTAASVRFTTAHTTTSKADMGNNHVKSRNAAESDFLTQLTSAYAKNQVQLHYKESTAEGNLPLYYTLGLGTSLSIDVMKPDIANTWGANVEKEDATEIDITSRIKGYWNTLLSKGSVSLPVKFWQNWTQWNNNKPASKNVTVNRTTLSNGAVFPSNISQLYYADKYYTAATKDDLANAFDDIVLDISIQQTYEPTLVEGGNAIISGEVSFVDTIGEYMHVSDIKGIILEGTFYSGVELARNLQNQSLFGTMTNPTQAGNIFAQAVMTDLGLGSYAEVNPIIDTAYNAGLLYYNSDSSYSNSFTWYADANDKFISVAHGGNPGDCGIENCGHTTRPANAQSIIESYFYMGEITNDENSDIYDDSNMLAATVWLRTDLDTGTETVVFSLPAALIPTVDYEVGLSQDDEIIRLRMGGSTSPAMLVYEVGVDPDLNIGDLVDQIEAGTVTYDGYDPATGDIKFWTNEWDRNGNYGYQYTNAYAYFRPGQDNTRYYFTEDTPIYHPDGYLHTDQSLDPSTDVGFQYHWYTPTTVYTGTAGANGITNLAERVDRRLLSDYAISKAVWDADKGYWYIPAGTAQGIDFFGEPRLNEPKPHNETETFGYADFPYVDTTASAQGRTVVGAITGNNGYIITGPIVIEGEKYTEGMLLEENQYSFALYETDATFTVAENAQPFDTASNGASEDVSIYHSTLTNEDGSPVRQKLVNKAKFIFDRFYPNGKGTHYYVLREQIPAQPEYGVYYDTGEYRITITVDENGPAISSITYVDSEGTATDGASELKFTNRIGVRLPETGGPGTYPYTLSGLTILIAVLLMYNIPRKKKRGAA